MNPLENRTHRDSEPTWDYKKYLVSDSNPYLREGSCTQPQWQDSHLRHEARSTHVLNSSDRIHSWDLKWNTQWDQGSHHIRLRLLYSASTWHDSHLRHEARALMYLTLVTRLTLKTCSWFTHKLIKSHISGQDHNWDNQPEHPDCVNETAPDTRKHNACKACQCYNW